MEDQKQLEEKILELEARMNDASFWNDKDEAKRIIKELQDLKAKKEGVGEYDRGDAVLTIFSGAGGDDAEDFSALLLRMYTKFCDKKGFGYTVLHENQNDHGGYRNITLSIEGKNAYGTLKHESGVHRLVRISPFNAKKLRHTSFSMVEVIPKIKKGQLIEIPDGDIRTELSRSSGPGGQNVNKRETAVRLVHIPTGIAAESQTERSQEHNKERALEVLKGKLFKKAEEERKSLEESMQISKTTDIEWGNQIRSYVLHPYKMVKDHRTDTEVRDVDAVLEEGEIEPFIEASKSL